MIRSPSLFQEDLSSNHKSNSRPPEETQTNLAMRQQWWNTCIHLTFSPSVLLPQVKLTQNHWQMLEKIFQRISTASFAKDIFLGEKILKVIRIRRKKERKHDMTGYMPSGLSQRHNCCTSHSKRDLQIDQILGQEFWITISHCDCYDLYLLNI